MGKRLAVSILFAVLVCAGTWAGVRTGAQTEELAAPSAPLLMASGESVQIAWTLPPGPKVDTVIVFRGHEGGKYVEAARAPASDLSLTDDGVRLGRTYQYRLRMARGAAQSGFSEEATVTVGGTSRIVFHGGSPGRAVFEVVVFRDGERVSRRFVHGPGEAIGDLAFVPGFDDVIDFRLGPTVVDMELGRAAVAQTQREVLKDAGGNPVTGPDGEPIELDFHIPGGEREVLIATVQDDDGGTFELREGETWQP